MLAIFERLYDMRIAGGPIFETYMRNAMLLVLENELTDQTLLDVPLVFMDSEFREKLKSRCSNWAVTRFWNDIAEKASRDHSLSEMAPYIVSKLNRFTTNAVLTPIIGQSKSSIDFRRGMDESRIVLVNLAKGLLGGLDCHLLGMLILGRIYLAAMARAAVPENERTRWYLYVDEAQNFVTDTIAHLLAETRKFGLVVTLANQTIDQLATNPGLENVAATVLGNVAVTGFLSEPRYVASIKAPDFNARELMKILGLEAPKTADPRALTRVGLSHLSSQSGPRRIFSVGRPCSSASLCPCSIPPETPKSTKNLDSSAAARATASPASIPSHRSGSSSSSRTPGWAKFK